MRGENLPALDGLRQEKFKLSLLTDRTLAQIGKGNIAVNKRTVDENGCAVNLDFIPKLTCAVFPPAGAISDRT
jgi:hypothetical protein